MCKKLYSFKQFSEENPAFPIGGLRHLAFHANTNGFKEAFPHVGRRRLIDKDKFFEVIEKQNASCIKGGHPSEIV